MVKNTRKKINQHVLIDGDWDGGIFIWVFKEGSLIYLDYFLLWKMMIIISTM